MDSLSTKEKWKKLTWLGFGKPRSFGWSGVCQFMYQLQKIANLRLLFLANGESKVVYIFCLQYWGVGELNISQSSAVLKNEERQKQEKKRNLGFRECMKFCSKAFHPQKIWSTSFPNLSFLTQTKNFFYSFL